jgi:hypothetical protein
MCSVHGATEWISLDATATCGSWISAGRCPSRRLPSTRRRSSTSESMCFRSARRTGVMRTASDGGDTWSRGQLFTLPCRVIRATWQHLASQSTGHLYGLIKRFVPDSRIFAFSRSDDVFFGILHSRFHEAWSLRTCSWHGVGNDPTYNSAGVFETFPFPEGLTPDIPAV